MTDSVSKIEMHNTPDTGTSFEPVGTEPRITFHVDWRKMKQPSPKLFHDIGDVQVTLLALANYIDAVDDEAVSDAYHDATDGIAYLIDALIEARDLSDDAGEQVRMGNLEALPEVEKDIEYVPAGGENDG